MPPETRYARTTDGTHVAYQINGDGPIDILVMRGWHSNLDNEWRDPVVAGIYLRLGAVGRVIRLDRRGTGLSDRIDPETLPTLEDRIDDISAVMVAAGAERIALVGIGPGGAVCSAFAAMRPERTRGLVLWAPTAAVAGADPRWALSDEAYAALLDRLRARWGTTEEAQTRADEGMPSRAGDPAFVEWLRQDMLLSGSANEAVAQARLYRDTDLRDLLPAIHVPTLIAWRAGSGAEPAGRHVAARIPMSIVKVLPGNDFALIAGDWRSGLHAIEDFVATLGDAELDVDRVLATLMFTDLVGSTELANRYGDLAWKQLVNDHHAAVRRELTRHRGREVDTAGDGFFAAFDGPARAIRCALAIRSALAELELNVKIGLHAGECERVGKGLRGVAVHIGARVGAAARGGEIIVSSTVRDLVAGSGIGFEDAGMHTLKGVQDDWHLYRVASI